MELIKTYVLEVDKYVYLVLSKKLLQNKLLILHKGVVYQVMDKR